MSRRDLGLLVGLLVIQGVLVQGTFVSAPHPGGDNAAYVTLAHSIHSGQGYTELWDPAAPPHTKYPPLFPFLLAVAMTLGASGWLGLKLVPALLAMAAVGGTFLWARRRLGRAGGFAVAVLTGLSPSLLYHAHWILSDVPFLAFTVFALWMMEHVQAEDGGAPELEPGAGPIWGMVSWPLVAGVFAVFLAYFTRSAGLPLLVAAVGALLLRRRWRAAVAVGAGVGVPALAWLLRGVASDPGQGRYAGEFFLVDPYQPDLGRAGIADFVQRIAENLTGYGGRFLPEALFGSAGPASVGLAGLILLLAIMGWIRTVRRGVGVTEAFVPLYLGLLLVWPAVWSGDRFALPLVPPLLLLAVEGGRAVSGRLPASGRSWLLVGLAVLAGAPGLQDWFRARSESASCARAVEQAGPWACGGRALVDFVATAEWAGAELPEDAVALTRKPRIWYLMSGIPSRTYPFTESERVLLEDAASAGADLVVLDYVGSQGTRFVGAALARTPDRFCQLGVFGGEGQLPPTRLLRILPPGTGQGSRVEEGQIRLADCPGLPEPTVTVRTGGAGADGIPILRRP